MISLNIMLYLTAIKLYQSVVVEYNASFNSTDKITKSI